MDAMLFRRVCVVGALLAAIPFRAAAEEPLPAVVQDATFIVKAPTPELGDEILRRANEYRARLSREWLGGELPPGIGQVLLDVRISASEDRGTSWVATNPQRLSHTVWLTTSAERAVSTTLAHEMTHVVLATQYPGQVPAWLNEGAASMEDDAARVTTRRQIMGWFDRTGNWPSLDRVLSSERIAPSDPQMYAVASSLTEFLLERSDRAKLLEFSLTGAKRGWDAALRTHYQIAGVSALQSQWQAWASQQGRVSDRTTSASRPRR